MDAGTAILKSKLNTLQEFSKKVQLPLQVEATIKRFIENNNKDVTTMDDQDKMLNELPPSLRFEVVSHTYGSITKVIKFFQNKKADFLWEVLPLLTDMKIYKEDILYNMGDHSEESKF